MQSNFCLLLFPSNNIRQGSAQATFSSRALILGHHETGMMIDQPIFHLFKNIYNAVHNFLF